MKAARIKVDVLKRAGMRSPSAATIGTWADAALGRLASGRELAVRIVGAAESRRLNAHYRGRDHATNVLSFPVSAVALEPSGPRVPATPLGDLVICSRVVAEEARRQGKSVRAHWAHLVVHGALHLVGYDHERPRDARRMARREIAVLKRLGYANPSRSA